MPNKTTTFLFIHQILKSIISFTLGNVLWKLLYSIDQRKGDSHDTRNTNDIRGIIIDSKEYRISQIADDTQSFLNGSENSHRETLDVLQKNYEMSGLKINVEKTKAIWIGSLSNSLTRLCHNYTLGKISNCSLFYGVPKGSKSTEVVDHSVYAYFDIHVHV